MIPIVSETFLSIERTEKLIQTLVDLRSEGNLVLPNYILNRFDGLLNAQKTSVNVSLLKAQQNFVQEICDHIHVFRKEPDESDTNEFKTIAIIVETCPEFLATKDSSLGFLPCHYAAHKATASSQKYLKLYADIGKKHNVGRNGDRGGLLVPNFDGEVALNEIIDPKVLDVLQKTNPPLFYFEDVRKFNLLHTAVRSWKVSSNHDPLVKYLCNLDPSCLYQLNKENLLPIHYASIAFSSMSQEEGMEDQFQYLIRTSVLHCPSNETVGGLFAPINNNGELFIDLLVTRLGMRKVWDLIEKALSGLSEFPILLQTIKYSPLYMNEVIKRFPASVYTRDNDNRLPIHVALEAGMEWSLELLHLITISQENLKDFDPVTNWPPFVLAGMETSCDLRTIYYLLRKNPEHVKMLGGENERKCKKRRIND